MDSTLPTTYMPHSNKSLNKFLKINHFYKYEDKFSPGGISTQQIKHKSASMHRLPPSPG